MTDRPRVVIAVPDRTESAALADWLTAEGLEPLPRSGVQAAIDEMAARPFDLLIADAVAFRDGLRPGGRVRNSRVPMIVIGPEEPKGHAASRQAMYLTRPVEKAMLMCFVSMAMLDGRPVRRSLRKPVNRFDAFVNGLPVCLVDVSNEGLRLEMPPDRKSPLPSYFSVRIPLVGVAVNVQRMWSQPSGAGTSVTWCGGALSKNGSVAAQGWRSFVETVPPLHESHRSAKD
jgi:hypothetical protein